MSPIPASRKAQLYAVDRATLIYRIYSILKSDCEMCQPPDTPNTRAMQASSATWRPLCRLRKGSYWVSEKIHVSKVLHAHGHLLASVDYTGFSETSRANIQMTHDTSVLTVSLEEAARIERHTSQRLLRDKKLSLIVDLDQTIIHATVDPTVDDWMTDENNPNHSVLRDVRKFRLRNEAGKEDGCWYYVKPRYVGTTSVVLCLGAPLPRRSLLAILRPALAQFLQDCSHMYEMHVYTMGTRQYAESVCRIIDPEGKSFANRILSRDESGSASSQN